MPRFTHPIWWTLAQPDPAGPLRIRMMAWLSILVRTTDDDWITVDTLVDTGASYSFMSTAFARYWNLTVPTTTSHVHLLTANGVQPATVRDADYDVRFPRLPDHTFDLRWLLRDDLPHDAPPMLGLHNTIDLLNIHFDGTMRPDGFMGCMEFITRDA